MMDLPITISVLGYYEDDSWVALALEMDLRGIGSSRTEALKELQDAISMQLSFANQKQCPELAFKKAEDRFFAAYKAARFLDAGDLFHEGGECDDIAADIPLVDFHKNPTIWPQFAGG